MSIQGAASNPVVATAELQGEAAQRLHVRGLEPVLLQAAAATDPAAQVRESSLY